MSTSHRTRTPELLNERRETLVTLVMLTKRTSGNARAVVLVTYNQQCPSSRAYSVGYAGVSPWALLVAQPSWSPMEYRSVERENTRSGPTSHTQDNQFF